jgi:chromosome segregation ATPase
MFCSTIDERRDSDIEWRRRETKWHDQQRLAIEQRTQLNDTIARLTAITNERDGLQTEVAQLRPHITSLGDQLNEALAVGAALRDELTHIITVRDQLQSRLTTTESILTSTQHDFDVHRRHSSLQADENKSLTHKCNALTVSLQEITVHRHSPPLSPLSATLAAALYCTNYVCIVCNCTMIGI